MRRKVLLTVALVAVLALAGCTGGTGPAANNTTTSDAASATYAPGVNETGVTSAPALSTAYADALSNTSYAVSQNTTVAFENGTTDVQTTLDGNVASKTHYNLTDAQTGASVSDSATTYFTPANDSAVYTRTVADGNASVGVDSEPAASRFGKLGVVDDDFVYLTFASADETNATIEDDATHLTASGFTVTTHHGLANVTDTQATAVVQADGTLTSLSVTYTATADGEPVHVTQTWSYDTDASVAAPSWTDQAE
ncbi:hypothetical protein [Halocalculus aciditolerans]|uniref:Lipoprotein n=1 Tax=Halocalculus aciditolerans TaxID=1383812 RepID=A0A830FJE3_9EURY|nr:hypothetical protein [Halocalculus aciditolerans]GGL61083.1 hypothetical protein GCM10009039_19050 [Halocalculus aciditolerans]